MMSSVPTSKLADKLVERKKTLETLKIKFYQKEYSKIMFNIKAVCKKNKENYIHTIPLLRLNCKYFDMEECRSYCIDKLSSDYFLVQYDENKLQISWNENDVKSVHIQKNKEREIRKQEKLNNKNSIVDVPKEKKPKKKRAYDLNDPIDMLLYANKIAKKS